MTCDLEWISDGDHAHKTKCGRYFVTKTMHSDGWRYAAFCKKPATRLGNSTSAAAAKQACVDHAGVK